MKNLLVSAFQVQRLDYTVADGRPTMSWVVPTSANVAEASLLAYFKGRLDLTFLRPGKDVLPAPQQGKAQDRIGVLFVEQNVPIKAGDRIVAIPNERGQIPVPGTFEIRYVPDEALSLFGQHHKEVQVVEVNSTVTSANWPVDGTSNT